MTGPPFLSDSEIALFERWVVDGLREGTSLVWRELSRRCLLRGCLGEGGTIEVERLRRRDR